MEENMSTCKSIFLQILFVFHRNPPRMPIVSVYVGSKRVICAVITKDIPLLKKLIANKDIPSVFTNRSVDLRYNALEYAVKTENTDAIKLLIKEYEQVDNSQRAVMPRTLMQHQGTGRLVSHGFILAL